MRDRPPFGYRPGAERLEVDPEQAAVVTEIAKRVIAGESMSGIANDLSERGIPTPHDWQRQRSGRDPRGSRWTTDALRAVLGPHLDGRLLVGRVEGAGGPVSGRAEGVGGRVAAPAILTPQTYAELEIELNRRRAAPLHGIVHCSCGSSLHLEPQPGKPPPQWDYECHLSIPAWWLEGDVAKVLLANLGDMLLVVHGEDAPLWTDGATFAQAWHAAEAEDKAAGSWSRRRSLVRACGLTLTAEEETEGQRTRLHGRLGIYRYDITIGPAALLHIEPTS
jgi:hypothetical protein